MDVKELINKAADEEGKSYKFYMDAIGLTKDAAVKVLGVWVIERMHHELSGIDDENEKHSKLKMLNEAAGYFRGWQLI